VIIYERISYIASFISYNIIRVWEKKIDLDLDLAIKTKRRIENDPTKGAEAVVEVSSTKNKYESIYILLRTKKVNSQTVATISPPRQLNSLPNYIKTSMELRKKSRTSPL
jgi:hypothetical protein